MNNRRDPEGAVQVRTNDRTVAGRFGHTIPVRDYLPATPMRGAPVVWLHGGGFMNGGLDMKESDAVARALAASGRPVRAVDYRLVPMVSFRGPLKLKPSENRYPAPLHDVLDAYLDFSNKVAATPALGGASAGACLALSAALHLRDGEGPVPAGLFLFYGTFHGRPAEMTSELQSRLRFRDRTLRMFLGQDSLERMNMNYGGSEASLDDHRIFPGGGDLQALPATLVINADRDGLRASGDAIVPELKRAAVHTNATTLPGTAHGFLNQPSSPGFHAGIEKTIEWLDAHTPKDN